MAYVKQKFNSDCGVACLAMLCDVSYEEARKAIKWRRKQRAYDTSTKQIREAALKFDYLSDSTPQMRLKVVCPPSGWKGLPDPQISDLWYLIPSNSLVKVQRGEAAGGDWHWVAWRKEKVYDPARGVFHPSKFGHKPRSYMQFVKLEVTQ